jgi:hypothetical protein
MENARIKELEEKVNELNRKLESKDEEKKRIQELYINEMKIKLEQNNQMIINMRKNHKEEMKKFHNEFEQKNFLEKKKFETEKFELMDKVMNLEKELILANEKNEISQKAEIVEFQKKYLTEMRELQKSFEDFKIKTYEEMKTLKKQKEEAIFMKKNYEQEIERLNIEWEQNENIYKENYRSMKNKLDSFKIFIKNNEILKNQLELSKSEIAFLKLKVSKLENSEKSLQGILLEKSEGFSTQQNIINTNFTTTDGFFNSEKGSNYFHNHNKSDYSNYNSNNFNLIPHLQNTITNPNAKINSNNNQNNSFVNNYFTKNNINDVFTSFGGNSDIINTKNKKRSNSKSILNSNTSKICNKIFKCFHFI